jgi:hypothetical protein
MDPLEFAKAMVRYEELYREMKELEDKIAAHVMKIESSQEIGNVRAKYTKGRTVYAYERVRDAFDAITLDPYINLHTSTIYKTDWRSICQDLQYDPPIEKEPVPGVKIEVIN